MLLVPTSLAASYDAQVLEVGSASRVDGDVAGLLLIADEQGYSWDLQADHASLLSTMREIPLAVYRVDDGTTPYVDWAEPNTHNATSDLGAVTIHGTHLSPLAALFMGAPDATRSAVSVAGPMKINSVNDPSLDQNGDRADVVGSAQVTSIHERFAGDFAHFNITGGTFTIVGDIRIEAYGPEYTITNASGTFVERTGRFSTTDAGLVRQDREQLDTLTLKGATLTIRAAGEADFLSRAATVTMAGGLLADSVKVADEATQVSITPESGIVHAAVPDPVGLSSAQVSEGPSIPLLSILLSATALVAIAILILARRRTPRNDLEIALLAMEERRWADALPPLTRIAKRDPTNAGVHIDRALCLEQVGRFEDAARAFEHALRAVPGHAEAHFYYARTLARMRESEAARVHLETALEKDPRLVEMARGEAILRGL